METDFIATAETVISAPREAVWNALVTPSEIKKYMFGAEVLSDWRAGSPIVWKGEWQGRSYEDKGAILEIEPGRLLRYSHYSPLSGLPDRPENRHTVSIHLEDAGAGTRLVLSQDHNADGKAKAHSERNWARMLDALKKSLEA